MKKIRSDTVCYVKSENNLIDPLTKGLSRNVISVMSKNTGMRPI
jgi:hypothetical protein